MRWSWLPEPFRSKLIGRSRFWRRTSRFTRDGKLVVLLSLGLGLAATNTGNNLLYLLLAFLLGLILVSGFLATLNLGRLHFSRTFPARVHAGEAVLVGVSLENRKRWLPAFSLQVEELIESGLFEARKRCYFLKIPAQNAQQTHYRVTFERRGMARFVEVSISTRFPFSFFTKSRYLTLPAEVVVFPRLLSTQALPLEAVRTIGETSVGRVGHGSELFELRAHRVGDSLRHVHWRRSAQVDVWMIKEHEAEGAPIIQLMLEHRIPADHDPNDPALDHTIDLVASLIHHWLMENQAVTLHVGQVRWMISDVEAENAAFRMLALLAFEPAKFDASLLQPPVPGCVVICHPVSRPLIGTGFSRIVESESCAL